MRDIASRFATGVNAVHRHKLSHLTATIAKATPEVLEAQAKGNTLLDKLAGYETQAKRIAASAEAEKDYRASVMAVRELVRIVETVARLRGEMQDGTTVNVLVASPEWATTQRAVLAALVPYPEAKAAVLQALRPLAVAA